MYMYCCTHSLSHIWLFATPGTVAHQAPLAMGFPRQEYWSGLPFHSPRDLLDPGIKSGFPELAGGFFFTTDSLCIYVCVKKILFKEFGSCHHRASKAKICRTSQQVGMLGRGWGVVLSRISSLGNLSYLLLRPFMDRLKTTHIMEGNLFVYFWFFFFFYGTTQHVGF